MLNQLVEKCHKTAKIKGFWPEKHQEDQVNQVLAKFMLIDTEVSEMVEAYVKQWGSDKIIDEAADIIIRLADLLGALQEYGIIGADIDGAILAKMKKNESRPHLHNKLM